MTEKRILALAAKHPFLTALHSSFQTKVRHILYLILNTRPVFESLFVFEYIDHILFTYIGSVVFRYGICERWRSDVSNTKG